MARLTHDTKALVARLRSSDNWLVRAKAADALESLSTDNAELWERVHYAEGVAQTNIDAAEELRARLERAEQALNVYEAALAEAEAIFGGEYADHYGPQFELAMDARIARRRFLEGGPDAERS